MVSNSGMVVLQSSPLHLLRCRLQSDGTANERSQIGQITVWMVYIVTTYGIAMFHIAQYGIITAAPGSQNA